MYGVIMFSLPRVLPLSLLAGVAALVFSLHPHHPRLLPRHSMVSEFCGEAGDSVMCEAGDGACGDERRGGRRERCGGGGRRGMDW